MVQNLSFFNFSLKKLLATETDVFKKARIKILFLILLLSLVKASIALVVAYAYDQPFQTPRAFIAVIFYMVLLKLILYRVEYINMLTHFMLSAGIVIIWTNIFISVQSVNISTLQFGFMAVLGGFYLLNRGWGIFYSMMSFIPVILYLILSQLDLWHISRSPEILPFPGQIAIVTLNFITIALVHYMYHQAFSENVAEKQQLNTQLADAVEEANKYAQSKSDFLSTMSHELRTPLNMVIGMTELLMESSRDKEQQENLRLLKFSAASLHTLINDILDFNKLDSGKLQLENINVNLYELMHTICATLEVQAKEKGLQLVLDMDDDIKDLIVVTDPTRITQIIYNLVGNGIKFTTKGSVTLSLKQVNEIASYKRILFSVKDTGIGISKDKHENIFEPFIQASTNTTRNFGGTGLGLSIVRKLLTLFESTVHLESKPGEGSHFFFEINFKTGRKPILMDISHQQTENDLAGLRLLVAEDNPMNTFLLKKLCTKWNIEPVIVTNGAEAIEALRKENYDIILMDIHMPEMDGYEASRAIRHMKGGDRSNVSIIALTASVSNDLELKIKEAGMDDYVRKPFNTKELYSKLREHFRKQLVTNG